MFGCPMWIAPQPQVQPNSGGVGGIQFSSVKELQKFLKTLTQTEDEKKKKKEAESKPKPTEWKSVARCFFWLTIGFPFVGPMYYFAVLGSWELLRAGMTAMLNAH